MTAYTASTSNASNKITAVLDPADGDVSITVNGTEIENGTSAEWVTGENTVRVVTGNKTYSVTVTKS